jgi:hypothetical protein
VVEGVDPAEAGQAGFGVGAADGEACDCSLPVGCRGDDGVKEPAIVLGELL